ncbi:hypothetical protein A3K73_02640 [Candidatus Pacearchaeota archaeon RBG_13_36_9]|nr:MAG: hypothetical protein A3K73_02640 [Candidatus Pacearchaeota archaeon RBG_13_36_9]
MVLAIVIYFFVGYFREKEERIRIQNELNDLSNKLGIDDVSFDSTDDQKLTLVFEKGAGGEFLLNETSKNVSRINVTVVRVVNQTNVTHTNITYIEHNGTLNGSNVDIITVNDVSGSMNPRNNNGQGDKIGELKNASRDFVQRILNGTNNRVGFVAYADRVVDVWSVPLTNNTAALLGVINSWSTLGSTCICCGIERGMQYLNASTRTKIMIVLSDGGANVDCENYYSPELSGNPLVESGTFCNTMPDDACDDAINITKSGFIDNRVTTYTIGFGNASGVDEVTLRNISLVGNGTYYFANLTNLAEIFEKIRENISWIEEINVTWNETVTTSWTEQINETINETVEIEVYAPETLYDYLKIVFYAGGRSCSQKENVSAVPGPHETRELDLTISPSCGMTTGQLTKIEVYAVAVTESGEEVISSEPIAAWEKESMYTRK